jgi:hypothetical protein
LDEATLSEVRVALGVRDGETTLSAVRRVVAERDAARAERDELAAACDVLRGMLDDEPLPDAHQTPHTAACDAAETLREACAAAVSASFAHDAAEALTAALQHANVAVRLCEAARKAEAS